MKFGRKAKNSHYVISLNADWLKSADLTRSTPTFKWEECRLAELNDAKR